MLEIMYKYIINGYHNIVALASKFFLRFSNKNLNSNTYKKEEDFEKPKLNNIKLEQAIIDELVNDMYEIKQKIAILMPIQESLKKIDTILEANADEIYKELHVKAKLFHENFPNENRETLREKLGEYMLNNFLVKFGIFKHNDPTRQELDKIEKYHILKKLDI